MSTTKTAPVSDAAVQALFDAGTAGRILRTESEFEWPEGLKPVDVRIERGWPKRDGGLCAEWSFRLDGPRRYALFARSHNSSADRDHPQSNRPVVTPQGLGSVQVDLPECDVLIHSPDRDPAMLHLAHCLDGQDMATHLAPFWGFAGDDTQRDHDPVECRLLGYRAGRRAAIAYGRDGSSSPSHRLVGKTYHDDRAERLLRLHTDLNDRLLESSHGGVCVATPVGSLPDLRMALFSWSDGEVATVGPPSLPKLATVAGQALSVLHRVALDGLTEFTPSNECRVVRRWQGVLERIDASLADSSFALGESLLCAAASVDCVTPCVVHRFFFE